MNQGFAVKFVVLTTSRTGSTWLIDLLNRGGVEAHGELFLDQPRLTPPLVGRADYKRFVDHYRGSRLLRSCGVAAYLDSLYARPRPVGFKLMYGQLKRYPEIAVYLSARKIRILHLVRQNLLDVVISEELARITGASHVRADVAHEVPRVVLEPTNLLRRLERRRRAVAVVSRILKLSTCPFIEISYEGLLSGPTELKRIGAFIGVPFTTNLPTSKLFKRGSANHRESIANYEEVRNVIAGTTYAPMLR
jgi:LPS sulfotransferase NodH